MGADSDRMTRINAGTLLQVFVRSFFIQGSFSAKYRQNLGFAFCMEPVGKRLWRDPADYRRFIARQSEHYNGNPFMATLVLGSVAHMEERYRDENGVSEDDIRRFKNIVGPATGSTGDRLFWSNLRPCALLAGVSVALAFGLWGAAVFLLLYNGPVWFLKLRWLFTGYRLGPKVVVEIRNEVIDRAEQWLERAGCLLAGFTASGLIALPGHGSIHPAVLIGGTFIIFLCSVFLLRRNIPLHRIFPLIAVIALIAGMLSSAAG